MRNLIIRNIQIEDADAISRIQAAIANTAELIDFRRIIKEQVRATEHSSFVAEADGSVVGYIICYMLAGAFNLEKSAWIANLGVDSRHMGDGVAKRLAEEAFRVFRENQIRYIYTSVAWDSVNLLPFFKTLGFDRSKFIILTKELGP